MVIIFALSYVSEILALLYGDFGMNSYSADSAEVMKRFDEVLNVLSLQYFRSIKRFTATNFIQR
jgi:hypothetical protein